MDKKDRHVRSLVGALRELVLEAVPNAVETVTTGYETINYDAQNHDNGHVCYIHPLRNHVNLGFYAGNRLEDPDRLLEGHGDHLRRIRIYDAKDIRPREIKELIRKAFQPDS
jgi:hypothetical protein